MASIRFGPAPLHARASDPLDGYPTGERQRSILCARPGDDPVKTAFCGERAPMVASLVDLQRVLDLDFRGPVPRTLAPTLAPSAPYPSTSATPAPAVVPSVPPYPGAAATPAPGASGVTAPPYPAASTPARPDGSGRRNPDFALTAHSTSLVTRLTSAINPRAIIYRQSGYEFIAMGYVRGEQFVELVTRAQSGALAFYLVRFRQACNDAPAGCGPGDLYTPLVEQNWTSYSVYAGEDVRNSVMDCAQCHQPDGPGTPAILRMQEQVSPWTHWLRTSTVGGAALLSDYFKAKGTETYAGIPGTLIDQSSPAGLQRLIADQGFYRAQVNEFVSGLIEEEVLASAPLQPSVNVPAGKSASWDAMYARNVAGETIAVPYHDVKVTDPQKLASLTDAYARYRAGTLPAAALPDLSQIFPADRTLLAEVGFAPKPGLDGRGLVRQLCSQCHNGKLDETISRARFQADLSKLSREEKNLAVQRVLLPEDDIRAMPPARFRSLTPEQRSTVVEALLE